ncbi:MAG: hypothetical protein WCP39_02190 [Chlamydiota bacterium]
MSQWPNIQTVITTAAASTTFGCKIFGQSVLATQLFTLPLRTLSITTAAHNKDYLKVVLDVSSYTSLFCPHGEWLSIGIDLASESLNFYRRHSASLFQTEEIHSSQGIDKERIKAIVMLENRQPKFSPLLTAKPLDVGRIHTSPIEEAPSHSSPLPTTGSSRANPKNFIGACKILNLKEDVSYHDLKEIEEHRSKATEVLTRRKAILSSPLAAQVQRIIDDVQTAAKTLKRHEAS